MNLVRMSKRWKSKAFCHLPTLFIGALKEKKKKEEEEKEKDNQHKLKIGLMTFRCTIPDFMYIFIRLRGTVASKERSIFS